MSADSALMVARARALSRMVDTCAITRPGSGGTYDPVTDTYSGSTTPVYSGACFVQERRIQNPEASSGGGDFPVAEALTLKLPSDSPACQVADIVVISAAPDHPNDVGRRYRITSVNPATQKKSRDYQMSTVIG